MRIWCIGVLIFSITVLQAQTTSQRCKWFYPDSLHQQFSLDSLTILPSSISINKGKFEFNSQTNLIQFQQVFDSVLVCYRVFPVSLAKPYFRRNAAAYDSSKNYMEDYARNYSFQDKREEIFASPGIQKNGNISRGISFGNNQNVFVNSSLNLQLEGKLTDDVSITAVISDQNIPFQPDGNTQQLQEFDKVYVQLKSKKTSLIVGDLVMKNQPSEFLRFNRNVQGGFAEFTKKDSVQRFYTGAGVAISKGKFSSMQFGYGSGDSLLEGVQGPYRLRGPNNERFIIVLANSEKVYLDGRLLKRGWEYDYVIDYNQAEITFTNNILITKFSRVRVDFEFSDRNYSRMIASASIYEDYKNVHTFFNYYIEKDNPNNPLFKDLSEAEISSLSLIGDTLSKAFVSGIDSIGFLESKILYRKIVSGPTIYYEYSVNPDSAFFDIRFSQVATGTGSYVLLNSSVNGRVFKYVGYPNGTYEPVQIIPLPKRKQMITLGGALDLSKSSQVFSELAFSQNDLNQYSNFDSQDDKGWSSKSGIRFKELKFRGKYKFYSHASYEFNHRNFSPIDRFRAADFERFWNESNVVADNNLLEGMVMLKKDDLNRFSYKLIERIKPGDINGQQHEVIVYKELKRLNVQVEGFSMQNQRILGSSDWLRYTANVFWKNKFFVPGFRFATEKNLIRDSTGKIISSLMHYEEQKFYIRNGDSTKVKYQLELTDRSDKEILAGDLAPNTKARTINSILSAPLRDHQITTGFSYRFLNSNLGPTPLPNEETVMGRLEWSGQLFNKHIRTEMLLVSATGRELKREFNYIPVPVGQGTHVWNDFNNDNIQQLDEFAEKKFDDARGEFIKVFVPTDSYIKAFSNTFNFQVDATAPRRWKNHDVRWKRFVSRFSNVISLNSNKKITDDDFVRRFNPFDNTINETDIISMQNIFRNTLFFNRTNPKVGWDINYSNTENKQFLTQGFEKRTNEELGLLIRFNLNKFVSTKNGLSYFSKRNASDFLITRNFILEGYKISPTLSWQPTRSIRLTGLFGYAVKENLPSYQKIEINESGVEFKINKLSHRSFNSTIKYIYIKSNLTAQDVNTPIGFEMLEALRPGQNMTWNFNWQEKLTNGLQLTFTYEGRKSQSSDAVHIGRMQVSALF